VKPQGSRLSHPNWKNNLFIEKERFLNYSFKKISALWNGITVSKTQTTFPIVDIQKSEFTLKSLRITHVMILKPYKKAKPIVYQIHNSDPKIINIICCESIQTIKMNSNKTC
jgi:hypothetical protein